MRSPRFFQRSRSIGATCLALATLSARAQAEEFTRKSFLLPDGSFEITGDPARPAMAGISLSKDNVGKPVTLAPHFYWGVSDDLTIGISHQTGLCLTGCEAVGDKHYNDAGFDSMLWLAGSGTYELGLHAGVPIGSFDPFVVGVQAGVIGRVNLNETVAWVFDPALYVGMSRRDEGNRESLLLPFWFYFQATPELVPFVGSGLLGPLDGFVDAFAIPLEGGVLYAASRNVDIGGSLRFSNLLGNGGSSDWRDLYFLGRFRF